MECYRVKIQYCKSPKYTITYYNVILPSNLYSYTDGFCIISSRDNYLILSRGEKIYTFIRLNKIPIYDSIFMDEDSEEEWVDYVSPIAITNLAQKNKKFHYKQKPENFSINNLDTWEFDTGSNDPNDINHTLLLMNDLEVMGVQSMEFNSYVDFDERCHYYKSDIDARMIFYGLSPNSLIFSIQYYKKLYLTAQSLL